MRWPSLILGRGWLPGKAMHNRILPQWRENISPPSKSNQCCWEKSQPDVTIGIQWKGIYWILQRRNLLRSDFLHCLPIQHQMCQILFGYYIHIFTRNKNFACVKYLVHTAAQRIITQRNPIFTSMGEWTSHFLPVLSLQSFEGSGTTHTVPRIPEGTSESRANHKCTGIMDGSDLRHYRSEHKKRGLLAKLTTN